MKCRFCDRCPPPRWLSFVLFALPQLLHACPLFSSRPFHLTCTRSCTGHLVCMYVSVYIYMCKSLALACPSSTALPMHNIVFFCHLLSPARFHSVRVFAFLPLHELSSLVFSDVRGLIAPPVPLGGCVSFCAFPFFFFFAMCVLADVCIRVAVLPPPCARRLDSSRGCTGLFRTRGLFRTGRQCVGGTV